MSGSVRGFGGSSPSPPCGAAMAGGLPEGARCGVCGGADIIDGAWRRLDSVSVEKGRAFAC